MLSIKQNGRRVKCVVLMHADPVLFDDAEKMVQWCQDNGIKHLPRQLDHSLEQKEFNYDARQVIWLKTLYDTKSRYSDLSIDVAAIGDRFDLSDHGRACCGGRTLCHSQTDQQRKFYVSNKFPDWFCSVNEFFLYIKQVNGEIYVNKDCKMDFGGEVAPIGHLSSSQDLISYTKEHLKEKTLPVIQCKKYNCLCGLCAPKARTLEQYQQIMRKYQTCAIS